MGIGALLAASLGSSLMSGIFNSAESAINRAYNAREAEKNRNWQEEMSSTAHQREVADLKSAGLNPILSAGGAGASVGAGASASVNTVSPFSSPDVSGLYSLTAKQLDVEYKNKGLDFKIKSSQIPLSSSETKTFYNSKGNLVRTVISKKGSNR